MSFPTVDGQSELLDVYTPHSPAPAGGFPVIVTIHGGGWRRFNKTEYGLRNANVFTRDGYVVVSPDYVLSAPGSPTWPVNFEDVQAAVRWVRSNAGTLGINPNEIVAEGESAGANLAALLGTYSTQSTGDDGFRGRRRRRRGFDSDRSDDPLQREPVCRVRGRAILGRLARASSRQLRRGIADRSCFAR